MKTKALIGLAVLGAMTFGVVGQVEAHWCGPACQEGKAEVAVEEHEGPSDNGEESCVGSSWKCEKQRIEEALEEHEKDH